MPGSVKCANNCPCNKHIPRTCLIGCACGHHSSTSNIPCPIGCTCRKHFLRPKFPGSKPCKSGCRCKRHAYYGGAEKGRKLPPEHREAIRQGHLAVRAKTALTQARRWADPEERKRQAERAASQWRQFTPEQQETKMMKMWEKRGIRPTSIELAVAEELSRRGLSYETEVRIGRFQVDFLLPNGVVLECDGAYWHRDEEKDRRRDRELLKRGYTTVRLTEHAIKADVVAAVAGVLS